MFVVIQRSE